MKLFAAIDIGSYEVEMKIFQITSGKGTNEIDCVCIAWNLAKMCTVMARSVWR